MQGLLNSVKTGGRGLWVILLLLALTGCVTQTREPDAPSPNNYEQAEIPGFKQIRFWGDREPPFLHEILARKQQAITQNPTLQRRMDVLALSGGGEDGAYGAGFLKGWTKRGNRPVFSVVTGISTGALIAPFAFLGSDYDDVIQRFYTETSKKDIFILTPLKALLGGSAIGDTAPLRRIIREEVTDEVVAAIARESRRGRSLFIGTTNLDAQRPVIWDIGRIAEQANPRATKLIGDIMLASAAIPGAFPPVGFEIIAGNERYKELHVDGGITNQIFVYPPALDVRKVEQQLGINPRKTFWLIRNTKVDPVYEVVGTGVADIAKRSISTLIKYQGRGDLIMLERLAKRDGFSLHLTYVPEDFDTPLNGLFDPVYMKDLYDVGYRAALSDKPWKNHLEGLFR